MDTDLDIEPVQYEALKARLTMMVRLAQMEFKASPLVILTAVADVFNDMGEEALQQERLAASRVSTPIRRKPFQPIKKR